jgi:hypothetical protein
MNGRIALVSSACLFAVVAIAACDHSAAPTLQPSPSPGPSPVAENATIAGVVWQHASDGVKPLAAASVGGWVQAAGSGWRVGPIQTDGDGRYSFQVPANAWLRVEVFPPYQPCVVTISASSSVSHDVHIVADPKQLGAHLPAELLTDMPTLTGVVFENTPDGKQPVSGVRLEVDMLYGLGDVSATTLTDSDGRYVLCGLVGNSPYIYASKAGFRVGDVGTVSLTGANTIRDIELQR